MEIASPGWLALLLLLPVLRVWRRRQRRGLLLPGAAAAAVSTRRRDRVAGLAPRILRMLALALLVLAVARPRTAGGVAESRTEGVPIVIAIDVSSSMLARDWACPPAGCAADQPRDRLDVAKATVASFIAARPDDPVGLVAFAAEAITLVPITTHQPFLLSALGSVRVGLLEDGTAIGEGLATAVNRLRRAPGEDRVIVLMSDGESNRGATDPLVAAGAAAEFGIRVYTIGVGSDGTAPVPVGRAPEGFEYAERPVAIDEPLLREVARATGGEYHRAADPEALRRVYERIDRLERAPVEVRTTVRYRDWYLWILAAAAAVLALEWALRGSRWGAVP